MRPLSPSLLREPPLLRDSPPLEREPPLLPLLLPLLLLPLLLRPLSLARGGGGEDDRPEDPDRSIDRGRDEDDPLLLRAPLSRVARLRSPDSTRAPPMRSITRRGTSREEDEESDGRSTWRRSGAGASSLGRTTRPRQFSPRVEGSGVLTAGGSGVLTAGCFSRGLSARSRHTGAGGLSSLRNSRDPPPASPRRTRPAVSPSRVPVPRLVSVPRFGVTVPLLPAPPREPVPRLTRSRPSLERSVGPIGATLPPPMGATLPPPIGATLAPPIGAKCPPPRPGRPDPELPVVGRLRVTRSRIAPEISLSRRMYEVRSGTPAAPALSRPVSALTHRRLIAAAGSRNSSRVNRAGSLETVAKPPRSRARRSRIASVVSAARSTRFD